MRYTVIHQTICRVVEWDVMCICKCVYNIKYIYIYIFKNFIKSSVRNALTPTNPGHLSFISSNPGSGSVATRCIILLKAHCRAICHDLVRLRSTGRSFKRFERIIIHRKAHRFKIAQKQCLYSDSLYFQNNIGKWMQMARSLELVSLGRIQNVHANLAKLHYPWEHSTGCPAAPRPWCSMNWKLSEGPRLKSQNAA